MGRLAWAANMPRRGSRGPPSGVQWRGPGLEAAPLPEDLEVIPALGFGPGELRGLRARPGAVWWGLRAGGDWVGAAGFDPAFPGATPFRVADSGAARALLDALRPHARPADPHLFVVVEGDVALEAALAAAGATETMRVIAMVGTLPATSRT